MVVKFEEKKGTKIFMKKEETLSKFEDLMIFQYGEPEESELAFNRLTESRESTLSTTQEEKKC